MMAGIVYTLSALTCIACTYLLLRSFKRGGGRLLLWSGICFAGLAINNLLAFIDSSIPNDILNLTMIRLLVSVGSLGILVYGLVWDSSS